MGVPERSLLAPGKQHGTHGQKRSGDKSVLDWRASLEKETAIIGVIRITVHL